MWKDILYVGLGGGIGSILRFLTSRVVARYAQAEWLFAGTFVANIIGSFLIGLFAGWMLIAKKGSRILGLLLVLAYVAYSLISFM